MLHRWHIDEDQIARHEARRGRRHAFETLDPARTALIVVDMVPFFVEANPYAAGIIPNVNLLADRLRRAGGTVVWAVPAAVPASSVRDEFFGADVAKSYASSGGTGTPAERLCGEMSTRDGDTFVEKSVPSVLPPEVGGLADRLASQQIETVVVVGTVANVCCESTVRDASALGFRTIMVADGNAAVSDADLNATLHTMYRSFADVRTTAEVIGLIEATTAY